MLGEHFDRLFVQMNPPLLPSFRFRDVDYAVMYLNVTRLDIKQLVHQELLRFEELVLGLIICLLPIKKVHIGSSTYA